MSLEPKAVMFRNTYLFCTDEHIKVMESLLEDPANAHLWTSLQSIIETDQNGFIVLFRPTVSISMGLLFFFQNLMVMQRMYYLDKFLKSQGIIK